ncbi:MAG: hypothetical protein KDK60_00500 [Chlamydiia bacterium]|nr:hypothetical protein [Chlamydiia bacterium]
MVKIIIGGLVGAVIAFVWSLISWSVLPWHEYAINPFRNEDFVRWVIKENAPVDGVYIAPLIKKTGAEQTPEEIEETLEKQSAAMKKGPFIYAQVRLSGIDSKHPLPYIYTFLTQFVGAALICALLMQAHDLRYFGRVLFVAGMGLIVGILGHLPSGIWLGAGFLYPAIMVADLLVTWLLAGFFLATFVTKPPELDHRELLM